MELEEEFGGSFLYWQHSRVGLAYWYLDDMEKAIEAQSRAVDVAPDHEVERMKQLLGTYEERLERQERDG